MRITRKTDYAVRALIHLAQQYGNGPIQSADIAAKQLVPATFLDQLLTIMRKAGFVTSTRGPGGGHALARRPSAISLKEVVEHFEGAVLVEGCAVDQGCSLASICAQHEVWDKIRRCSEEILASTSIEDLAERQTVKETQGMYYI